MDPNVENSGTVQGSNTRTPKNIGLLVLLISGFISAFAGGFIFSTVLSSENNSGISPTPAISPAHISGTPMPNDAVQSFVPMNFEVGNHYFDDTVLLLTKNEPRLALVASVTRTQNGGSYTQNTRVSFFNGSEWTRKTKSGNTVTPAISADELVKAWDIQIDASRVLREKVSGKFTHSGSEISFDARQLSNEMVIRSLPGYTKFMSEGDAMLTVDGTEFDSHILYTRIYSSNTKEIQFYSAPIGLTTDWLVFWGADGSFYHLDSSDVSQPTDIYKTHQISILKDREGRIEKSFQAGVTRDTGVPPELYTFSLFTPSKVTLSFTRKNAVNKSGDSSYSWFLGTGEGFVKSSDGTTVPGVGFVEYIHD